MIQRNPFTPTFGIVPNYLAGRDGLLNEMARSFENGLGDPNLVTVLIGAQGSGKTSLLSCIGDEARNAGWIVADTVAAPGMMEDILERTSAEAATIAEKTNDKRLTGINIGQLIGLEWTVDEPGAGNWRTRMLPLLSAITERGSGLLITVDEIDPEVSELIQLVSTYQLFIRERLQVALVMAGLPKNATDLIDDKRITFLRRARKRYLSLIGDAEVRRALKQSFASTGKSISDELLDLAVRKAGGFPYIMQLVSYNIWAESGDSETVSDADVERGIAAAMDEFTENVLRSTVRDMSEGDLRFARAMLDNDETNTINAVAARMGKGANYASTYKTRLLKQGVIEERNGGFVFAIPLLRDYLANME